MKKDKRMTFEDDGRVIADMSGIERPPMLIPRFKRQSGDTQDRETSGSNLQAQTRTPMARDDRNAFIKGSIAAALLVAGVFALAFAALIVLIGHMG